MFSWVGTDDSSTHSKSPTDPSRATRSSERYLDEVSSAQDAEAPALVLLVRWLLAPSCCCCGRSRTRSGIAGKLAIAAILASVMIMRYTYHDGMQIYASEAYVIDDMVRTMICNGWRVSCGPTRMHAGGLVEKFNNYFTNMIRHFYGFLLSQCQYLLSKSHNT